jgi:hypothetical protein
MATVSIGNKTFDANVIKIRPGQELAAQQTAAHDGQDNTFFKLGSDTYVASGLGTYVQGLKNGDDVTFDGKRGTVVASNNEQDTKADLWATGGITAVVTALAVGGAIVAGGPLAWVLAPAVGLFAGGIGGGFTWRVFDNRRKAKENLLAQYGA